MMNLDGFELAPMVDGGEFTLYRGSRERDGLPVIVATPSADQPASATLARMRRSYELRDALDSGWACTPIELIQTKGRLALAMADPGGVRLEGLLGAPLDIDSFLRMAAGVAAAVAWFHGKGFIHRDIKPGTLMIDPESGHAWLSGFGLTLRHPRQHPSPDPVETLAGTLAYMAPEQTGRMNRSVDARSDLYALGVIYYEMLTGELPFVAADPMELMHLHIARKPAPPQDRRAHVPAVVSAIVMKLLAKASEARYQTATGLERDLRRCIASRPDGVVASFALGEHDDVIGLLRPETLYGREHEIETLVARFEHACRGGQPEIVMVSGYSGIGKSSVVHELHKALVPPRGLFAAGKFDQYTRDVPYATLAQALDSLVKQLLVKSEADLRPWRESLVGALGGHGGAIVRLVPELEQILGLQTPDPELPPRDAQLLFQTLVKRVFAVFARRDHPLVLFFDDLQWIDTATLELLEVLCTDPAPVSLLVVGAYRDNEVDSSHPVARMLDRLRLGSVPLCEIHLGPISFDDTSRLLADGLRCDVARVEPLSSLVCDKTGRNPFFTLQFFWALEAEGLLWIDPERSEWQWDLERIASKGFTDNVAHLMLARIDRLPAPSRSALRRLACLGNRASADVLGAAFEVSAGGLQDVFGEAVRAGLVATMKGGYAFVHDRVQEAAYASLPVTERRETHLALGRLLLAHADRINLGNQVFDVVDQFNRCRELVTEASERAALVRLNVAAALRARSATSFASTLAYFVAAHEWAWGGSAPRSSSTWARSSSIGPPVSPPRGRC